jgi:hypothetical protein
VGSHREGEFGGGEDVDSSAGSDALVVGVDKWHRWSRGGAAAPHFGVEEMEEGVEFTCGERKSE